MIDIILHLLQCILCAISQLFAGLFNFLIY